MGPIPMPTGPTVVAAPPPGAPLPPGVVPAGTVPPGLVPVGPSPPVVSAMPVAPGLPGVVPGAPVAPGPPGVVPTTSKFATGKQPLGTGTAVMRASSAGPNRSLAPSPVLDSRQRSQGPNGPPFMAMGSPGSRSATPGRLGAGTTRQRSGSIVKTSPTKAS